MLHNRLPHRLVRHAGGLLTLVLLLAGPSHAAESSGEAALLGKVHDFLLKQADGTDGEVTIEVHPPRAALSDCPHPDISLPRAADRPIGRVSVGIRCGDDNRTRYLQADIHITGHYVALTRDVRAGDIIRSEDLTEVAGRLDRLPHQTVLAPDQAIGQQATRPLASGTTLQHHHLRARSLVKRGQQVVIEARGTGFRITRRAEALESGGRGERIRVRLADRDILEARVIGEGRTAVDI